MSRALINETYSTLVQGFMPTLARPEVDVLDGHTSSNRRSSQFVGVNRWWARPGEQTITLRN